MLKRVSHLKSFITSKYPIPSNKFELVKIGPRIWIYVVTQEGTIARSQLFTGALETVEDNDALKKFLITNIEEALKKWNYYE